MAGVLGHAPSAELASRVYERSGGNAFLAEELLAARERDVLVPGTVQSLVLARVAGLTAPARDLVRLAAVAGVRVSHGLLAAASGLDDEALLMAARELAEQHLLVADRSGQGYAFRHALTREAVYGDLLPGERQMLHLAAARTLSGDPALGPAAGWAVAEAVAEHWFAAGELERALPASVTAGTRREVLALTGALGHYKRALELWGQVADPETVAGLGRPDLLDRAAEVASGAGDHECAIGYVDAAIDELERSAAAPDQLALLYQMKYIYLLRAGRSEADLLEWTEHAVALVPHEPLTAGLAAILAAHACALSDVERFEEASKVAAAALEAARAAGAREQECHARTTLGNYLTMASPDPEAGPASSTRWWPWIGSSATPTASCTRTAASPTS